MPFAQSSVERRRDTVIARTVQCAAMADQPPCLRDVARYRVIFADCDPMRVMYHANYLCLFEIGRAESFRPARPSVPDLRGTRALPGGD